MFKIVLKVKLISCFEVMLASIYWKFIQYFYAIDFPHPTCRTDSPPDPTGPSARCACLRVEVALAQDECWIPIAGRRLL